MIAKDNRIIIANWKMSLNLAETKTLAENMVTKFKDFNEGTVVVCPNQISLQEVNGVIKGSPLKLGSQHVFWFQLIWLKMPDVNMLLSVTVKDVNMFWKIMKWLTKWLKQ